MSDSETTMYDYWCRIGKADADMLKEKEKAYGGSWCKRGGVGAFMNAARKWDRLENLLGKIYVFDIFEAVLFDLKRGDDRGEGVLDTIRDLRCYLTLIEAKMLKERHEAG